MASSAATAASWSWVLRFTIGDDRLELRQVVDAGGDFHNAAAPLVSTFKISFVSVWALTAGSEAIAFPPAARRC